MKNKYSLIQCGTHEIKSFYDGVRQGIALFARWRNGTQFVDMNGTTLKEALEVIDSMEEAASHVSFRDHNAAFNDAINDGVLSLKEYDKNFVGDYMYMHSETNDGKVVDFFKHRNTRQYICGLKK